MTRRRRALVTLLAVLWIATTIMLFLAVQAKHDVDAAFWGLAVVLLFQAIHAWFPKSLPNP
jgi:hypothetical protein